ncbi:helix-turn-helix transcriptional regulator [Bacillus sp. CH30_1T]|nr:helix-turn-helix transcriptional regulator [Bacillus sp. CH30_1T]
MQENLSKGGGYMSPIQLKNYIEQNGIKQVWLAQRLNCSKQTISNYINGRYQLSQSKMKRLKELVN